MEPVREEVKVSVVMCTWQEELMLPLALESIKNFADEIIIVNKDPNDASFEIAREAKKQWGLNMRIYNRPELILRYARMFGMEKVSDDMDWVMILDGDEVVHTDGPNSMLDIKKRLGDSEQIKCIKTQKVYLIGDFFHYGKHPDNNELTPIQPIHPLLYKNGDDIHFDRDKHGFDGLPGSYDLPEIAGPYIVYEDPLIFNCNIKNQMRQFLRLSWYDWCKSTDSWVTTSLEDYAKMTKGLNNLNTHVSRWFKDYMQQREPYREDIYGTYPKVIRDAIKRGCTRGDPEYFTRGKE